MQRVDVQSSNVKSVSWDQDVLTVEFRVGAHEEPRIYQYTPVLRAVYDLMFEPGASVGRIVGALRSDRSISCERIESTNPSSPVVYQDSAASPS